MIYKIIYTLIVLLIIKNTIQIHGPLLPVYIECKPLPRVFSVPCACDPSIVTKNMIALYLL